MYDIDHISIVESIKPEEGNFNWVQLCMTIMVIMIKMNNWYVKNHYKM